MNIAVIVFAVRWLGWCGVGLRRRRRWRRRSQRMFDCDEFVVAQVLQAHQTATDDGVDVIVVAHKHVVVRRVDELIDRDRRFLHVPHESFQRPLAHALSSSVRRSTL